MKKRSLLGTFTLFLMIIVMVGCSKAADSSNASTTSTGASQRGGGGFSFADIGLYGEISEIVGNEVTLKVLEIPKMPAQGAQEGSRGSRTDRAAPGGTSGGAQGDTSGAAPGAGGSGGGFMREKKYTGEEKTLIIPVGTPIVTISRGDNGMTESEVGMNELASGSTLSIYYKEDGTTIEKIRLQKPRTGGAQGGNFRN